MSRITRIAIIGLTFQLVLFTTPTLAGVRSKVVQEVAELALRKVGREASKETVESLAHKIEVLVAKHGPPAVVAIERVGPRAVQMIEEAGPHGDLVARLLARHGERAVPIVCNPRCRALAARLGDEAVEVMIRHPGIAPHIIESGGQPAVRCLETLNHQNARRLAMLVVDQGDLATMGRSAELLDVIGKYGDRAMEFVWRHKGALTVTAVLAAFLAEPKPFIDGVKDITKVAAETVARPMAEVPGHVAEEGARRVNWTVIGIAGLVVVTGLILHYWRRKRPRG